MKRMCPVCKSEVRTCSGPRKNQHGDSHLYVYCPVCSKKYHVFLDEYGNTDRIVDKYERTPKKYQAAVEEAKKVLKPTGLKDFVQSVVEGSYKEPVKLNLKQKPKESTGILIKIDPIPEEEGLEIIKNYFQL